MRQAQGIADVGDRWFVGFAKGVVRLGSWARKEADVASDAASAAMATTVDITRRLTGNQDLEGYEGGRRPLSTRRTKRGASSETRWSDERDHRLDEIAANLPPLPRLDDLELDAALYLPEAARRLPRTPTDSTPPPPEALRPAPASERAARTSRPSRRIDLQPAYGEEEEGGADVGAFSSSMLANPEEGYRAGVAPLLQALGDLFYEHGPEGYESLQEDERFWAVLGLLQLLTKPPPESHDDELNHQEK